MLVRQVVRHRPLSGRLFLTSATAAERPAVGQPAPACELAGLGNGTAVNTAQFKGKVVYVDFWASWCIPCAKSFPVLNQIHRDLRERGLQIVGVNVDEHSADADGFLQKHPADFTVGADAKGICPKAFGVVAMPSGYLIDRQGVIRHIHYGFREGEIDTLRADLEHLLGETPQVSAAFEPHLH